MTSNDSPTRPFSDEFIMQFSHEHLYYEFKMLLDTRQLLSTKPLLKDLPITQQMKNAYIESFAIHFRNLVAFFYGDVKANGAKKEPQEDDVFAIDFMGEGVWEKARRSFRKELQSTQLRDDQVRVHKEIAHLTTRRYTGNDPNKIWEQDKLSAKIMEIARLFSQHADRKRLHPRVFGLINSTQDKLS